MPRRILLLICCALALRQFLSPGPSAAQVADPAFEKIWRARLISAGVDPADEQRVINGLRDRLGPAGDAAVAGFQSARQVIPFLAGYGGFRWPERPSGGMLDTYIEEAAGNAPFRSFRQEAEGRVAAVQRRGTGPDDAARELDRLADATEAALARVARQADPHQEGMSGCVTDLQALAMLARYHRRKIAAGAALVLFYRTGDVAALRMASSNTGAGLVVWERLVRVILEVERPPVLFGREAAGYCRGELLTVRYDAARVAEIGTLLDRYGLFDFAFRFGPGETASAPAEPALPASFRLLQPGADYSRARGYGWRDTTGIRASEASAGDPLLRLQRHSFLRGSRNSTLEIDLPAGEYRVTSMVANQPELASGAFRIAAGRSAISYDAAETGYKSMDVQVSSGRLGLDFVPVSGGDWLVSELVVTRRAPHFGWVPVRSVAARARTFVAVTITAPDAIREAALACGAAGARPVAIPLVPDQNQMSAAIEWPAYWAGRDVRCQFSATDRRGTQARWPSDPGFRVDVTPP